MTYSGSTSSVRCADSGVRRRSGDDAVARLEREQHAGLQAHLARPDGGVAVAGVGACENVQRRSIVDGGM